MVKLVAGVTQSASLQVSSQSGERRGHLGFAVTNRGFAVTNRGFAVTNRGFAVTNRGFAVTNRGFAVTNRGFAVTNRGDKMQATCTGQHTRLTLT
jgi:hypothetical protein